MRMSRLIGSAVFLPTLALPTLTAEDAAETGADLWSKKVADAQVRLIDLSAIVSVAAGATSADARGISISQTGGHDPVRDGFTFQGLELGITGAVDPYFRAAAYLHVGEEGLELEEAYGVSTCLPWNLELEAGYMLTEFGRYNPRHRHADPFIDQPLAIGVFLGAEGMRGTGARIGWTIPLPWQAQLSVTGQNADDETMTSFLGGGHDHGAGGHGHGHGDEHAELEELLFGGYPGAGVQRSSSDLLWSGRLFQCWGLGGGVDLAIGVSGAHGPNRTWDDTTLLGADAVLSCHLPSLAQGAGRISFGAEYIHRFQRYGMAPATPLSHYEQGEEWVDFFAAAPDEQIMHLLADGPAWPAPGSTVRDQGLVGTVVCRFHQQWSAGARVGWIDRERSPAANPYAVWHEWEEFLAGSPAEQFYWYNRDAAAATARLPEEYTRLSALVTYHPSSWAKVRFQYNCTDPNRGPTIHSCWIGLEISIGTHSHRAPVCDDCGHAH